MDNVKTSTNATKTTSGYDFTSSYGSNYYNCGACMYRLPCGYCKELERPCPYTPITTTITCGSTIDNVVKT
jgi:hypothetical protein